MTPSLPHDKFAAMYKHGVHFNPLIARQHGIPAALVLKQLTFLHKAFERNNDLIDGFFYRTIDQIKGKGDIGLPFLSRSTIHRALVHLKNKGLILMSDKNTGDHTTNWYRVTEAGMSFYQKRHNFFYPEEKKDLGIHGAVLINYLRYNDLKNKIWEHLSPTHLAEKFNISKRTVQRELQNLVDNHHLKRHSQRKSSYTAQLNAPEDIKDGVTNEQYLKISKIKAIDEETEFTQTSPFEFAKPSSNNIKVRYESVYSAVQVYGDKRSAELIEGQVCSQEPLSIPY